MVHMALKNQRISKNPIQKKHKVLSWENWFAISEGEKWQFNIFSDLINDGT